MEYSATLRRAVVNQENREIQSVPSQGDEAKPDYQCMSYRAQQPVRNFVRTVWGGTRTMRESEDILPRHPGEALDLDRNGETYNRRKKRTTAFNALARTAHALVGMVFRKDPVLSEDVPATMLPDLDDVDRRGNALAVFARNVAEDAMIDGHAFIHVESPQIPENVRSRADASTKGIRPYWLHITADRVINWRYTMVNGEPRTDLLVYTEKMTEPTGDFGEAEVVRFLVLRPGSWERFTKGEKGAWTSEGGSTGLDYVPVVPLYAKKTGEFESCPPLLDLAFEQVDHFQVRSDYRTAMTFSALSIVCIKGAKAKNVKWGANYTLTLEEADADAKILESSGAGLGHMRQELLDTQERMAALGLEMLVRGNTQRTATEAGIRKTESTAALSTFAIGVEDALNRALEIHADYRSVDAPQVTVNRDFEAQTMDPQVFQQLREAAATGQISLHTLWERMVAGELLPDSFDAEAEVERLAEESAVILDAEVAARSALVA